MEASDLIKAARAKVALGWTQGIEMLPASPPRFCMMGALKSARNEIHCPLNVYREAEQRLAARARKHAIGLEGWEGWYESIARFNDWPGTSHEAVLALMDEAAGGK